MDDGLDPLRVMYGQADGRRCFFALIKINAFLRNARINMLLEKSIMKGFFCVSVLHTV